MYYGCRYISSCEAAWRLLGFELQYKYPPVTRLSFHLENKQSVVYEEDEDIEDVLNKKTVKESMFLEWMEENKKYPQARLLTYADAPSEFVWDRSERKWRPRKQVPCVGRLYYVPPGCGDNYYLRCLLTVVRGATCYADYRKHDGVQHASYREACYARGLLEDDREYVDGIAEASEWASAQSLRRLFVSLLSADTLARPEEVWDKSWQFLSEDVLYRQRRIFQNPGGHHPFPAFSHYPYACTADNLPLTGGDDDNSSDNKTIRFTRVKLLRPTDTLVLGRAYRLVTTQEVMKVLRAKKHAKMKKNISESGLQTESEKQSASSESENYNQGIISNRHRQRTGSANLAAGKPKLWRPSLQSITEGGS
ncbi:hypothetical protein PHJA_001299400 [Phtheirospermum japonicum]|uniref:Uncharacterized protein n=1 Tax=Phtheirospermum japonicum TaxID=374723 RepID=A0A830C5M0_9LAMI|nr:hypothetical protein PHJA_001299400 [Phtheirospermum japonicum]